MGSIDLQGDVTPCDFIPITAKSYNDCGICEKIYPVEAIILKESD